MNAKRTGTIAAITLCATTQKVDTNVRVRQDTPETKSVKVCRQSRKQIA